MQKKSISLKHYSILISAIIYCAYSFLHLENYPFVHSDEIWLLKLSEHMAKSQSLFVSEPFFNLFPRLAHAIKILFHAIQIGWAHFFGFNVRSMRALTLLVSLTAIILFYQMILRRTKDNWQAALYSALIALNIQFIYMSHFARQEAFIFLALVAIFYILERFNYSLKSALIAGVITGFSIGIHPNSFLLATSFASVLLLRAFLEKQAKPLIGYILSVASCAVLFIALSLAQDGNFFSRYAALGATMGTAQPLIEKVMTLPLFFYKLYHGISGTYYLPNIRISMIISALLIAAAILAIKRCKYELVALFGLTAGLIIIGRYNATSIVFYLPFVILLLQRLLENRSGKLQGLPLVLLIILFAYTSYAELAKPPREDFATFNATIESHVYKDDIALANLNQAMAIATFYDYRNLAYLAENNQSIDNYLAEQQINVIIWSEELDYIYRNIDDWYILYGEMPYYLSLKKIIDEQFTAVASFESPLYGCRIVKFQDGYPWQITIYRRIE